MQVNSEAIYTSDYSYLVNLLKRQHFCVNDYAALHEGTHHPCMLNARACMQSTVYIRIRVASGAIASMYICMHEN